MSYYAVLNQAVWIHHIHAQASSGFNEAWPDPQNNLALVPITVSLLPL